VPISAGTAVTVDVDVVVVGTAVEGEVFGESDDEQMDDDWDESL